jgi:hypothetical protein
LTILPSERPGLVPEVFRAGSRWEGEMPEDQQRSSGWAATGCLSTFGAIIGLAGAAIVLLPLSQCLIDCEDDDVVLWTIRYFKYAAVLSLLACGIGGAALGYMIARLLSGSWPNDRLER